MNDEPPPENNSDTTDSTWTQFICSLDKLLELLGSKCHTNGCERTCTFSHEFIGCCLTVSGLCAGGHEFNWASSHIESQNTVGNRTSRPGGRIFTVNMEVTTSLVISGNNCRKIEMFLTFLKMPMISDTTFYSYQRSFILKGINQFFQAEQVEICVTEQHELYFYCLGNDT